MVGSIAIQRYHRMNLLDLGRLTVDGIARAAFWWDRVRANCLYGCMVRSIAIRRQHRMGSLHSGGQTTDGITRTAFWQGRGCTNCSYGLIRGGFWCNHRSTNSLHGFMARGVAIRRYQHMGLLDSGVKTVDGIMSVTLRPGVHLDVRFL